MNRRDALKYSGMAFGYALTAGAFSTMLQSCQNEVSSDAWKPSTLSQDQFAMVSEIAETILPKTDTPGAKDVMVDRFIDEYYTRFFDNENRAKAMSKMALLEEHFGGKAFVKLSDEEKMASLSELNKAAIAAKEESDLQKAFLQLKGLIISTYFSSEQIGTEVLAYNPVPGPYVGCIPYEEAGKVWSPSR